MGEERLKTELETEEVLATGAGTGAIVGCIGADAGLGDEKSNISPNAFELCCTAGLGAGAAGAAGEPKPPKPPKPPGLPRDCFG